MNNAKLAAASFPYILMAPDYLESSLGVQVVHRLCHLLNERGYQAWLVNCAVNPAWNTPLLSIDEVSEYSEGGKPFIAVYPEIVSGNPLNAQVVVRYMLNREGVIERNALESRAEDLIFWYREEFADKQFDPQLLTLEMYDLTQFCDDQPVKDLDLLYLNRVPKQQIDFSTLPAGIRVLSMENPLPLHELAAVLKRGRVLYSYESSGTCVLATLCGCPVVARTLPGYEHLAITAETLTDNGGGIGWSDDEPALLALREELPLARQQVLARRAKIERQLDSFVSQTQQRARDSGLLPPGVSAERWLQLRAIPDAQRSLLAAKIAGLAAPVSLLVIIRNSVQERSALQTTLDSLAGCRQHYPFIRAVLTAAPPPGEPLPAWASVAGEGEIIAESAEHWVQVVEAGSRYLPDGWLLTAQGLAEADNCFAVFADELSITPTGELETALRPDFSLDLVLSTPWRFARRWLFRREVLASLAMELFPERVAWELEAVTRLIETRDINGIGHISEPLLVVPDAALQPDEIEVALLQRHLQQRGYPAAEVVSDEGKPFRLHYGPTHGLHVSVIIPASGDLATLQRCIDLILTKTSHQHYQIIVVRHAATGAAVNGWLDGVHHAQSEKVKVVTLAAAATPAEAYNAGAAAAQGDFVLLLHPLAVIVQKNWLSNLLNHAQRPEVGCVGGKLISLQQRVLSAGEILTGSAFCQSMGFAAAVDDRGYMQRLQSDQNISVLNYCCLLIKKQAWDAVAGMTPAYSTIKQLNIDLCLKLRQLGYLAVWTPYSVVACEADFLYPRSKIVSAEEQQGDALLRASWLPELLRDPAYSIHCAPLRQPFIPEWRPALLVSPLAEREQPRVLGVITPAGMQAPAHFTHALRHLDARGTIYGMVSENALDYGLIQRMDADARVVDCTLADEALALLAALNKREHSVLSLALNAAWIAAQGRHVPQLQWVDRLLVENEAQAEAVGQYDRPVVVLPRVLIPGEPAAKPARRAGQKLRVLCNTLELDSGDLELVQSLIRELSSEVSWQILGPMPAGWLPWIDEHYRYPGQAYYLPLLASMDSDLAIVPRADSKLNRLKDAYVLLELAACGIPALVSDVSSLHSPIAAQRVRNRKADWQQALRQAAAQRADLSGLAHAAKQSLRPADWLTGETVEQHLRAWLP